MRRARVHQNGYVFRKGNFWYVRYYDRSIQPDGTEVKLQKCRQLVEFCGIYRTKTAVRVLADEFLAPFNNGKMKPASTMSLTDFIEGRYLPFVKSHQEASTYAGYKNMFTRYLKGRRSNIALRDARTGDIETMLTDIVKEFDPAKTTVQHIKSFLSGVFHYAKRLAILDFENPVRDAVLPKCKELEDTYAYTLEEILATLEVLPEAAAAAVAIAGFAGLREGEIEPGGSVTRAPRFA